MRLVNVEIEGYRRFKTKQRLQLDPRMVALLGPNEAGKTSVLKALLSLNDSSPITPYGPNQDVTRGLSINANADVITARFLIEKEDIEALSDIEEAGPAKWFVVHKPQSGKLQYTLEPNFRRNVSRRKLTIEKLKRLASIPTVGEDLSKAEHGSELPDAIRNALEAVPDEDQEVLSNTVLDLFRTLAGALSTLGRSELADELSDLVIAEQQKPPMIAAIGVLKSRVPRFVLFEDEDRYLGTVHDLDAYLREKNRIPTPRAFENLASTAELDLAVLLDAVRKGDIGKRTTLIEGANETLKSRMREAWSQSIVDVSFSIDGTQLSILAKSGGGQWESVSERSDGLKQFVALLAFLSRSGLQKEKIILLVDEVEQHLHYDAQADLIQMLGKQELSKQVIYTTHSYGCLPEDLGLGIRFLHPEKDQISSRIVGKFWSENHVGLSPILFGMGAATMAFLPVRYCVLVEGPTDMLLFPALLRAAMNKETLGFQISPGLSQCDSDRIALIQNDGSRVVFLVDGDEGGKDIEKKLRKASVLPERIFRLDTFVGAGGMVEDLVKKEAYARALNEEFRRSGRGVQLSSQDIPNIARASFVEKWCREHGFSAPPKVDVAYRILDKLYDAPLIEEDRIEALQQLCTAIEKQLRQAAEA